MNIRKIAVVGSFAAGAALAFAPLAAADNLTSTVDTEMTVLNDLFQFDAGIAGVPSTDYSLVDGFDVIKAVDVLKDAPTTAPFTPLDYELYGINPAFSGPASDPGSYNVFNGALTEFYDAYNSDLYGLLNNGALIPTTDLFGSGNEIATALATGTDVGAGITFFDAGANDLLGFFDLPSLF